MTPVLTADPTIQSDILARLYEQALGYFQECLQMTAEIEEYCSANGIDIMSLGFADGGFSKIVSPRHKSFKAFQKLKLINEAGKDVYADHLVIPKSKGVDISGLDFIPMESIRKPTETLTTAPERLNGNSFKVTLKNREYTVDSLMRTEHSLKAVLILETSDFPYEVKIDFRCADKRRKALNNIVEDTGYPVDEIKDDIKWLSHHSKDFEIIASEKPLSQNAVDLIHLFVDKESLTSPDIKELTEWHGMKIKRATDELLKVGLISQLNQRKPIKYQITPNHNEM